MRVKYSQVVDRVSHAKLGLRRRCRGLRWRVRLSNVFLGPCARCFSNGLWMGEWDNGGLNLQMRLYIYVCVDRGVLGNGPSLSHMGLSHFFLCLFPSFLPPALSPRNSWRAAMI